MRSPSPAGIVITTLADGKCIDVNDSFTRITGYSSEEALGCTSLELGFWQEPEDRDRATEKLRAHGSFYNLEFKLRDKAGEIRQWLLSSELIDLKGDPCIISA